MTRRRVAVWMAAWLAAAAVVLGFAARPASAHASLEASEPAAGAVLTSSPGEIRLTFDEPVSIGLGGIRLFDGDGVEVSIERARQPAAREVVAEAPALGPGSYVVDWQVVSADSHPAHGAFTFQIGDVSDLTPGVLDSVVNRDTTDRGAQIALGFTRGVVVAAMAMVIGAVLGALVGAAPPTRRLGAAVRVAGVVGAIAGAVSVGMEAGYASGDGFEALVDGDAWRAVLDTRLGIAWVARAAILLPAGLGLAPVAAHGASRARGAAGQLAVVAAAAGIGVTSAFGGHGATGRWELVGIGATVVHVVAMALWIGGLAALLIGFGVATADHVRRFSRLAMAAATVVVVSGVVQMVRQVGGIDELTDTTYGRLLIGKTAAVVAVLAVAAVSRYAIHGSLVRAGGRRRSAPAHAVGAAVAPDVSRDREVDRPVLRRAIGLEVVLAAAIISLTSALMGANPTATAANGPFSANLVQADYLLTVTVDPATAGLNQVHLYLSSPLGALDRPRDVALRIANPARGVAPIDIPVFESGAGHYQALEASIPFGGAWDLEVVARFGEFDLVSFRTSLDVAG